MGTFFYIRSDEIYFIFSFLFEASASEPESPVDSLSSSQTGRTLSDTILDALATLRRHRLGPFDLILEILNEDNPQYSYHRTEFYKVGNQKLFRILDVILASNPGKGKLKTWIRQPAALDLVCDVITEEMNVVQKAERLPGIAAITTPDFINDWTVSPSTELAPCLSRMLYVAAQTATAEEKNKKKHPDVVCIFRINSSFVAIMLTYKFLALQYIAKATELPAFDTFPRFSNTHRTVPMGDRHRTPNH